MQLFKPHGASTALEILRDAPAAPARGREATVEVDRRGPGAGHSSAEGRTGKKRLRPAVKRQMVAEVMSSHRLSQRRACGLIGITRRSFGRVPGEDHFDPDYLLLLIHPRLHSEPEDLPPPSD